LGGDFRTQVALELGHIRTTAPEENTEQGEAERHLLIEMLRVIQTDTELWCRFPWAMAFPEWRIERKRRRNSLRSQYAVDCVDRRQLAEMLAGLNLFRDIFPAARCVLLICFLSTTNTPQLAAGIFYLASPSCR
jgi:hypothetical protein